MKRLHLACTILGASLLLSACGHSAALPPNANANTLEKVAFSIPLPKKSTGLTPKYVSPATQSAGIIVTPSGSSALAQQVVNCSTTACSGSINAPVGSDTFAVSLYSGTNAGGNVLSAATVTQTITAGVANTVTLSFNGVPASIALNLSSTSFTAGTAGSITITTTAKDFSGNTIIGTYSTPVTLTNSDTTGASTLSATTLASSSSSVTLTYTAAFAGATISASDTGCSSVTGTLSKTGSGGGSGPVQYLTQKSATLVDGSISAGSTSAIVATLSGAADPAVNGSAYWNLDTLSVGSGTSAQGGSRQQMLRAPLRTLTFPRYHPAPEMHILAADKTVHRIMESAARGGFAPVQRRPMTSTIPTTLTVGTTVANIWVAYFSIGSSNATYTQLPATLEAQTTHGNIWVDNSLLPGGTKPSTSFSAAQLSATMTQLSADFENAYSSDTVHFASPDYSAPSGVVSYCNSSGTTTGSGPEFITEPSDKRVNTLVINSANLGNGVGGYFTSLNYFPQAAVNCFDPTEQSNEAPIFYVGWEDANGASFELKEDLVRGMAHEFQHEINFVNHGIISALSTYEDAFINEGLSMLAQDLAVNNMFGSSGVTHDSMDALEHAQVYLSNPGSYSVSGFTGIDPSSGSPWLGNGSPAYNCGGGCYGSAFLAQRYFYDRCGGDAYSHAMETGGVVGGANIIAACKSSESFGQLMSDFATAIATSTLGVTSSDPRFVFGLNLQATYPSQFTGASTTLSGANVITLGANASGSVQVPIGGFAFTQLTSIPAAGENASISDQQTVAGFGLAGALVQH